MTAPKTKRDRAAGRQHRHTALQTIIDNHETLTTDLAEFEGTVTQRMKDMRGNIGYSMGCIVENERKVAEIESALALLQESSKRQVTINTMTHDVQKGHQEAIAQLIAYTNKVNGRADALQQEITILNKELDETNKRLIQLAWVSLAIWFSAALTIAGIASAQEDIGIRGVLLVASLIPAAPAILLGSWVNDMKAGGLGEQR